MIFAYWIVYIRNVHASNGCLCCKRIRVKITHFTLIPGDVEASILNLTNHSIEQIDSKVNKNKPNWTYANNVMRSKKVYFEFQLSAAT